MLYQPWAKFRFGYNEQDVEAASKMLLLVREGILRAALENLEPV